MISIDAKFSSACLLRVSALKCQKITHEGQRKDGRVDKMYLMSVSPCFLKPMSLWAQMPRAQMS